MIEQFLASLIGVLTQSSIVVGLMYFWVINLVHRLVVVMSLQPTFVARDLEKIWIFLRPHPPNYFGAANTLHFTHGKTNFSFDPSHRNFEHIHLSFSRIPLGIQASDIQ
jgi:hypothetical protein